MSGIKSTCKFEKNYEIKYSVFRKTSCYGVGPAENSNIGSFLKKKKFFLHISFPVQFNVGPNSLAGTWVRRKTEIAGCWKTGQDVMRQTVSI